MVLYCSIMNIFWLDVQIWISEMGFPNFKLPLRGIILGVLAKSSVINYIIPASMKIFYNANNDNKKTILQQLYREMKKNIIWKDTRHT